jgi:tetratricopeptide (TPR) repeat protein
VKRCACLIGLVVGCVLLWTSVSAGAVLSHAESPTQDSTGLITTNWDALSGAYLHLQQQVHDTKLSLEQNRQEAERTAARNAELLAVQLRAIEQSVTAQRTSQLEEVQKSSRLMLMLAGLFAGIGLLSLLGMAWFQWQTVRRLTELSTMVSPGMALGPGPSLPRLTFGGTVINGASSTDQANGRWAAALAQLEQRIGELEHATRPALHPTFAVASDDAAVSQPQPAVDQSPESARIRMLLGKGQSQLNLGQAAEALECFQEAAKLAPGNAEALVKQGTALEQLGKLDQAIACYDSAIAADPSMTMAYLYKGGIFNRTQRFKEALECYELALHTKTKRNS